jgi:hypothetical protein
MQEELKIIVYRKEKKSRALDFVLKWTALDQPIRLQGAANKSYGGFTFRFAPRERPVITEPRGKTEKDLTVTRLRWADLTSRFSDGAGLSGAAVMIQPEHPDYPPTWLTRHYGVLCVGWPGVQPSTLKPGEPVKCAYCVWLHRGKPEVKELQEAYEAYKKRSS